ncbi:MAG: diaminopimelate epimerase [Firmicutes bacterium]|nr:diaminopimelate epimerase [Bacillota bacterium]
MRLEFWKLHGCGNDYLYFDVRAGDPGVDWPAAAIKLCDRHFGVGADGIILIDSSDTHDARMHIFNSDGSRSEMCGNGLRAMAKWLFDRGYAGARQAIDTDAGTLYPEVVEVENGKAVQIRVNMGPPRFQRRAVSRIWDDDRPLLEGVLTAAGREFTVSLVSMGNPHLIIFGPLWDVDVMAEWGPRLEHHEWFPDRINVHSVEIQGPHAMAMRHWERGAGLTLACGTGVAAATAAAMRLGKVSSPVRVIVPGGVLETSWGGQEGEPIYLQGPAEEVFYGTVDWDAPSH